MQVSLVNLLGVSVIAFLVPFTLGFFPNHRRGETVGSRVFALAAVLSATILLGGCARSAQVAPQPPTAPSGSAESSKAAPSPSATASTAIPPSQTTNGAQSIVTIGWVGDTTPGSSMGLPPQHGRALFSALRSQLLKPDILAGNLEGTFGSGGPSKSDEAGASGTYSFQAPPAYAESLAWAGFDVMNIANNHAYDFRDTGLAATRKALDTYGIEHTGMSGQITVREANGVKVAFIGVSPYWWSQSLNDIADTASLVRQAKKKAAVVVVIMHAGAEGADKTGTPKGVEKAFGEDRGNPRAFSRAMIDAGASVVVGSGPHVVRGIERYKGKLIAYSLGNFAGWGNFKLAGNSALSGLLTVRVNRDGEVLGGRLLSLKLAEPGVPELDSKNSTVKLVTSLSKKDFADTFSMDAAGNFGAGR